MKSLITLLVSLVWTCSTFAAPTYYTDRLAFEAAIDGGLSFESFEGIWGVSDTVVFNDFSVSETGGINALAASSNIWPESVTDGTQSLWYDDNGDSIGTFFSFSNPVSAFGLDLTTTSDSVVTIGGNSIVGSASLTSNTPSFWGVVDPDGILTITFDASGGPLVGFDAVSYGEALPVDPVTPIPATPVPTLSQWALIMLSMFFGLIVFANRRRLF